MFHLPMAIIGFLCWGLYLLACVLVHSMPKTAKVGQVFAHANPGTSEDPNEPPDPFVAIQEVLEVKDGKVRARVHSIRLDGRHQTYESWRDAYGYGQHDEQIR